MKLLTEWNDFENTEKQVIKAFSEWWYRNLEYKAGTEYGSLETIFGFPYTSSGMCAELGCRCNSSWVYKWIPEYQLCGLAVSEDGFIVAYFDNDNFDDDFLYIPIGKIKE